MIQSIPKKSSMLTNFRVSKDLMRTFDLICRFHRATITSIIFSLIREYVNQEIPKVQNELESHRRLDKTLEYTNLDGCLDAPPVFFNSSEIDPVLSGDDDWKF